MDFEYGKRVMTREQMQTVRQRLAEEGKRVVFTNGCFDILHSGHLAYLTFARQQGDCLVVGLNSDESVRRNKGSERPLIGEQERALMLTGLRAVDYVVVFNEDEPRDLIADIVPDVLVKGKDWAHYVSGREVVERNGGKVVLADMVEGRSTSDIIAGIEAHFERRMKENKGQSG